MMTTKGGEAVILEAYKEGKQELKEIQRDAEMGSLVFEHCIFQIRKEES